MIRTSRGEAAGLLLCDLAMLAAAFVIAYVLRFRWGWLVVTDVPAPPPSEYARAFAFVAAVFVLVLHSRRLYGVMPARGFDVVEGTWRACTLAALVVLAVSFFYREVSYSRSVGLIAWLGALAFVPLPRALLLARRRRLYRRGRGLVPALLVGSAQRAADLHRRLGDHRRYGLDVVGALAPPASGPGPAGLAVLGALEDLEPVVLATGAREVLICDSLERLALLETLERCERLGVEARVVPQVYDLFVTPGDLTELHGVPFIAVREQRFERLSLALKRLFDIGVAGTLVVACAPLLALLIALIRRESPGPALFAQRRIGEGGRVFWMWKLRSMVVDAEARLAEVVDLEALEQPVFKPDRDPRVTRVGRWLRRWSLDELPQLWNVLRGDMSLVGPRPEMEAVVARYDAHHRRRLKAKPGLTGLQQIVARASPDLDERIRLDVYYIKRRTFLYDLWLLLRTPWAVLVGRGAR